VAPGQSRLELARATAAVHDMGMAVDQAGRDQPTAQIVPVAVGCGHPGHGANPDDPVAPQHDGPFGHGAVGVGLGR
jgi:hypothetical protein